MQKISSRQLQNMIKRNPGRADQESRRPIITVVTTFYNAEKFLLNAVNSVTVQQTGGLFTIDYVIVDDKSPDKSRQILEQYIKDHKPQHPDIEFNIIEPDHNLGCGGARRFGIEHGRGDYFMFLDADDYYMRTDFLYRAFREMTGPDKPDIVEWGIVYNTPDGNQQASAAPQRMVVTDMDQAEIMMFKDNIIKFNVWSKTYTRAIIESYPYAETRTFEDVRTTPVWLHNAKKVVIMPSVEINYRAAAGSIIREDMIKTRLGTISAIAELFPRFKDNYQVLKAMYKRSMVDLEALLHGHSSENPGFNEMSKLNTEMLKYLYPDSWQDKTFDIADLPKLEQQQAAANKQ